MEENNNTSCRPACESLVLVERQMHAANVAMFNRSFSSSPLDTIFESATESARLYDDFGTAAHIAWDGASCVYGRCCRQRKLKQECCEQGGSSFSYYPGSPRLGPIATARYNKQRQRSPISRRGLVAIMRIPLGAASHRPNSPGASPRITSGSTLSISNSTSKQQDRWQSVVTSSAATTRVPALVGTRLDSLKKEGIQSVSLTVRSLPREKEMKKREDCPNIDKLLEQKCQREQQEEEMDLAGPGRGEPIHVSTVAARGA
jgi:hypothetical protein